MVKSKKYVLVSLVLGLSTPHGINAASAGSESGGVTSGHSSEGVGGAAASGPRSTLTAPAVVDSATLVTQADLVSKFFPIEEKSYDAGAPREFVSLPGALWGTNNVEKPTAKALLDNIIRPYGFPVHQASAAETIGGAYKALEGLMGLQKRLVAAIRGGTVCTEDINLESLFGLNSQAQDTVGAEGYASLEPIRDLFSALAEKSKTLNSVGDAPLSVPSVFGGLGEVGAALDAAARDFVGEMGRGVAAGMHKPLFNDKGSVVDNVSALYRCLEYMLDHIRKMHLPYSARMMARLQAEAAAAQAEAAAARTPLEGLRGGLADARQSLDAARADVAATREDLARAKADTVAAQAETVRAQAALAKIQAQEAEWVTEIASLTHKTEVDAATISHQAAQIGAQQKAAEQLQAKLVELAAQRVLYEETNQVLMVRLAASEATVRNLNTSLDALAASKKSA